MHGPIWEVIDGKSQQWGFFDGKQVIRFSDQRRLDLDADLNLVESETKKPIGRHLTPFEPLHG